MRWLVILAALASGPAFAQDAENGAKVFRKCMACHSLAEGMNRNGPTLHDLVGRPVAKQERYAYSAALRDLGMSGAVWDAERLSAFLADPKGAVPGTKMVFAGLRDPQDVADIVAYLTEETAE
ncbi:c-type cytochrome [Falsirhodobacter algicola]|uniref:C-type cytochrome n=1 Tax=Falsirhodobacter algicola TaxID=2692330 RepID=A0A8J8MRC7_9RHOB|nr:cytochrome c family protein [Falsirhodobacter algicola]QUS34956.1 c-type cytochrome [Falsirhodobacter algicola]